MNSISTKIDRKEWLEIGIAMIMLILSLFLPSFLALCITGIIFAIYAFFKPFQSLVILVPYVIFRTFFIEINTGVKLVGDLITFVVLFRLFVMNFKSWKTWFYFKPFEWAFFVFLIFGSIIGIMNGVSIAAVIFQLRTFLIMYILYYVLSRSEIPKNFLVKLAWITVFSGAILFIQGIVEKITLRTVLMPELWMYKILSATNFVRVYGLVNNPNSLALVMFFAIGATIFLQWAYKGEKYKIPLYIAQVAFAGLLILTLSRGTWILAFTFIVFFVLLTRNWKILSNLAITGIAALVLVYYPINYAVDLYQSLDIEGPDREEYNSGIGNRFSETFDEDTIALMNQSGRLFYIKKGFEVLKDYPITGSGFGTFGGAATLSYDSPIYKEYGIRSDIYGGKNFYSDNQYIQIIAETGAIGVLLFATFLLTMFGLFWKERKSTFGKYMIALWFATGVGGFFYNIWELKVYMLFFFMLFALFASSNSLYPKLTLSKEE